MLKLALPLLMIGCVAPVESVPVDLVMPEPFLDGASLWSPIDLRPVEISDLDDCDLEWWTTADPCAVRPSGGVDATLHQRTGAWGIGSFERREIWLDGSLRGDDLVIVTAHEIGHVLGLEHHDRRGLMSGRESPTGFLTAADLESACDRFGRGC